MRRILVLLLVASVASAGERHWQTGKWTDSDVKRQVVDFGPGSSGFGRPNPSAPTLRFLGGSWGSWAMSQVRADLRAGYQKPDMALLDSGSMTCWKTDQASSGFLVVLTISQPRRHSR